MRTTKERRKLSQRTKARLIGWAVGIAIATVVATLAMFINHDMSTTNSGEVEHAILWGPTWTNQDKTTESVKSAHCKPLNVGHDGVGIYTCSIRFLGKSVPETYQIDVTADDQWAVVTS